MSMSLPYIRGVRPSCDDVWDVSGFLPRTAKMTRIDFTTIADPGHARTVREYLHSRLNRGIAVNQLSGTARPMKLTGLYSEFAELRLILRELAAASAARLADVAPPHLDEVLAGWKRSPRYRGRESRRGFECLAAHQAHFLTDRLRPAPWQGRPTRSPSGASRRRPRPASRQEVIAPLLQAACSTRRPRPATCSPPNGRSAPCRRHAPRSPCGPARHAPAWRHSSPGAPGTAGASPPPLIPARHPARSPRTASRRRPTGR